MNRLIFILFLFALNAGAQPLWRASWTTNIPPALISVNDANGGGITNIGANGAHYGLWHFYGNDSNTIARLADITGGGGGSGGGDTNATYLLLNTTNSLPNAKRLLADMATILQVTNGADIIHRVSQSVSNWGNFSTNAISDTASNIANAVVNAAQVWTNGVSSPTGTNANVIVPVNLNRPVVIGDNYSAETWVPTFNLLQVYQTNAPPDAGSEYGAGLLTHESGEEALAGTVRYFGRGQIAGVAGWILGGGSINYGVIGGAVSGNSGQTNVGVAGAAVFYGSIQTNIGVFAAIMNNDNAAVKFPYSAVFRGDNFDAPDVPLLILNTNNSAFTAFQVNGDKTTNATPLDVAGLTTLYGGLYVPGGITNGSLSPSKLVSTGTGTQLVSSAFSDTDISDLQGATNALDLGKISIQGGAGNNNILTNLTLQNSASVFSPNSGATFPFGIAQSGNDLVFSHPDTTDQILMTATGLVANGSAVTNLPTSLTNSTHYDLTAGSKGLKTLGAGNGLAITNETGTNLVPAIDPAIVASQANLTSASNTLRTTFIANDTITSNGAVAFAMTVSNAVAGIVGETNWNGEVSVTNSDRFGWVNGKANNTNLLRSFQPANGLKGTNESGTNISLAIDPAVVASQANLTAASNTLQSSISDLQGSTNGLNTRVGNLEGATNGLNAGKLDKLNGTGTNFSASLFTGTTNSPLVARNTNSQPLGFEIGSNGVALFGTNFQSGLLLSNNLGTVTLTESNSPTSAITISTANVGIGTNSTKALFAVAVPNSNTVAIQVSGVFGQQSNLMQFETNGIVATAVKSNGCIVIPNGTASFPSIGFNSDDDGSGTGLFRQAANSLGLTVNGNEGFRLDASGNLFALFNNAIFKFGGNQQSRIGQANGDTFEFYEGTFNTKAITNKIYGHYTNKEFVESGYDSSLGTFFVRSQTNASTATMRPLSLGTSTNQDLILKTNHTTYVSAQQSGSLAALGGTLSVNTTTIANAGTAQTNLMTYSVPGNSITNTSDRITFTATGRFAANADAKELLVIFGSETILDTTSQIVNSGSWTLKGEIIRTGNTAQSAWAEFSGAGFSLFTDASSVTLAQTNGILTTLAIAATCGGSGDATNRTLTVQYWPAP